MWRLQCIKYGTVDALKICIKQHWANGVANVVQIYPLHAYSGTIRDNIAINTAYTKLAKLWF